jgi:hypothetical protein
VLLLLLVLPPPAGGPPAGDAAGGVDFTRDIAPLLERACLRCHGGERARGGLRVDRADSLGQVVQPGSAAASELARRLTGAGGGARMPAGEPPLPAASVALVGRWIDAGAPGLRSLTDAEGGGAHWAFRPLSRPAPPPVAGDEVGAGGWDKNAVDRFVLARLAAAGLAPAPEADRATLLRRVTLDLTGLPPAPAELDAFAADTRPDAYERVVDRLLASPHFGERWAVPWLDGARYADSNGFEKDGRRSIWPWRDWVVRALNDDLPFDRFVALQLAGDGLPGAGLDGRIATGFLRNTPFNEEGGVDQGEAGWERKVDRVATTATLLLGLTLGCAQCHDHKHDPFTQRDFYGLLAFFEDAGERTLELPTPAQARRLAALRTERAALARTLATWTPALGEGQRRWEQELAALERAYVPLSRPAATSSAGAPLVVEGDGAVLVASGPAARARDEQRLGGRTALAAVTAVRLAALPDARLPGGGPGRGRDGQFFLEGISLHAAPAADPAAPLVPVPLRAVLADDRPREEPERYAAENLLDGAAATATPAAGEAARGWGVFPVYDGARRLPRQLVLVPAAPVRFPGGARLEVRLRYGEAAAGEVIGRVRLAATAAPDPARIVALAPRLRAALARPEAARPRKTRDELAAAYRLVAPALAGERARLEALAAEERALGVTETLVTAPAGTGGAPATPLRLGGAYARPGEPVAAAVPRRLAGAAPPPVRDRRDLAAWLTGPGGALVARVRVNRLWAQLFGRGLVETDEDFGTAGARPSHPELLEHLAGALVDAGWRQKRILRALVTSATYRQSSRVAPGRRRLVAARDPDNVLLARGPRLRLDAEMVRDLALAAGGLLDARLGGPPAFPPQPAGVFDPPNSREAPWPAAGAGDRHRRALYTFWRRTAPYPPAALFDAPSRQVCSVRRARSNTPLQALVTLNDPAFWEAAQALGRRMRDEPPAGAALAARLAFGFRLTTSRLPDAAELAALEALYHRARGRACSLAPAPASDAAFALVANVLLNLDETLTRS